MYTLVYFISKNKGENIMTDKKASILQFLKDYAQEKGFPPTLREISKAFGFASPRSAQKYVEALEKDGEIVRSSVPRGIKIESLTIQTITLPFLGFIAAGAPIEVLEHNEVMDVPRSLVGRKPCYILQVKGDSMIEDHILNGDFIIVEKRETADDGEVVVALIDNTSATLKRMFREKNRVRLEPANVTLKPLYVKDIAVQGVVKGLFRKF